MSRPRRKAAAVTFSFRLPLRFLRGSIARLALTVLALACGVALVCAIDLVNRAVLTAFSEVVDTMAGRAALQISAGGGGLFPADVVATVLAEPSVELAVPVVSSTAFVADDTGELLTVHGVEITDESAVRVYEARDAGGLEIDDPLLFLSQPDSVVLTRAFAERRGLSVGSRLRLETPAGLRDFTVRGLLEPRGVAQVYGGNLVVMDLDAAQAAFAAPGFINRIDVVVDRFGDVRAVAAALAAHLPAGLDVEAPSQRKANLHDVMRSFQVLLQGVSLVGVIAAFLIAFNRLSTVFEGRAWQLGLLRAAGVRASRLTRELLKESLLLGMAGVGLGIPMGIAVGRMVLPIISTATALSSQLVSSNAAYAVRWPSVWLSAAIGLAAALAAALLPAWRVARASVASTLRARGRPLHPNARSRSGGALLAALVAVGAAVYAQSLTRSASWGLVATVLIAIATALCAPLLVRLVGSPRVTALLTALGPAGRFAGTILGENPRRTALTVGMLGVGLGVSLWLWMMARSFEQSVIDVLNGVVGADLVVTSAHVASGFVEAPLSDRVLGELAQVPGVQAVAGERVLEWEHQGGPITINAFDAAYFNDARFGRWPLYGERIPGVWQAVARGAALIVSSNFALNLHVGVGDTLILATPSGPLPVPVGGVTMDFASPRGTIEMSRELFARAWHDPLVTRVFVQRRPEVAPAAVRGAITKRLGRTYGLRLLSAAEMVAYFAVQVERAFAPLLILSALVLVVVLVGMADTLAADIAERTRAFGALRAVGVRRRHLGLLIVAEAALLGAMGLLLALGAGLGLGTLWVLATFPYLLGWVLNLEAPVGPAAIVVAMTVIVCLCAALLPARRAARLNPAVALRYE